MIVRILLSRRFPALLAILAVLSAVSLALGPAAIVIDLREDQDAVALPYAELCAVVGAAIAVVLLRPRFWEWDRLGRARSASVAGFCAIAAILLPTLVALPAVVRVSEVNTLGLLVNVVFSCALITALAPSLGPVAGGMVGILAWFGSGVTNNLEPSSVQYTPVVGYSFHLPDSWPADRWQYAAILALLAIGVHVWTRGSTAVARRMTQDF